MDLKETSCKADSGYMAKTNYEQFDSCHFWPFLKR